MFLFTYTNKNFYTLAMRSKNKSWKNWVKSYKWKNGKTEKTRETREGKIKKR